MTSTTKRPLYSEEDTKREVEIETRPAIDPEPYRSPYRRDYARIIHSPSFRRLQGKTQVFAPDESDFFRNRLTHSLEVAQIAVAIAARLNSVEEIFKEEKIDLDVVEVAALAHDLGHPPFGHNGEKALDDCMKCAGGFEGNAQTFHIIARTEKKQVRSEFPKRVIGGKDNRVGLNLTYRCLASTVKYDRIIPMHRKEDAKLCKGIYSSDADIYRNMRKAVCPNLSETSPFLTIEASIMDLADDIAYSTYDLEDTFKSGFLNSLSILASTTPLLKGVATKVSESIGQTVTHQDVYRCLYNMLKGIMPSAEGSDGKSQFTHTIRTQRAALRQASNGYMRTKFTSDLVSEFISAVKVRPNLEQPMLSTASLSNHVKMKVECLKHYTFQATIMSPRLRVAEARGYDLVRGIFQRLDKKDGYLLMPEDFRSLHEELSEDADKLRVIADFIAGMTDRYAVEFYGRLVSENPTTMFKPF